MVFKPFHVYLLSVLCFCWHIEAKFQFTAEVLSNIFPFNLIKTEEFENVLNSAIKYKRKEDLPNFDFISRTEEDTGPKITVPGLGTAKGRVLQTVFGRDFFAFHSIPYAQEPSENRRFQMPKSWDDQNDKRWVKSGYYDASYFRAKCPQLSIFLGTPAGREDCLHLSIYTPTTISEISNASYPVMFFIHGGAFLSGDSTFYVPTKLMEKDVVIVTVQYRLGSLGFLASETPDNPGNMGLMDQIMALRWVQKYIQYFGGDSNSVTLFGQSAGSASTSWMQFTPHTTEEENNGNQLFHRAITQSGTALNVWAYDPDPEASFKLQAEAVGCWNGNSTQSIESAISCMREKTLTEIVTGFTKVYTNDRLRGGLGFKGCTPIIQKNLLLNYKEDIEENPNLLVLEENPLRLIRKEKFLKIPIIAGAVRDEGSVFLGYIHEQYLVPNDLVFNETFLSLIFIPHLVADLYIIDQNGAVANSFQLSFLKNVEMGNFSSMSGGLVDMIGMSLIKSGVWQMTHYQSYRNNEDNIYFYSFEVESDDTLFDWFFMGNPSIPIKAGICHGDDLLYMFHFPSYMDERQKLAVKRLVTLWTNFAKYSDPTPDNVAEEDAWSEIMPKWRPFTLEGLEFLLISDNCSMEKDFTTRLNYNTVPDTKWNPSKSKESKTKSFI